MKPRQIIVAALLGFASSLLSPALPLDGTTGLEEKMSSIQGRVVGVDERRPRAATVVIEQGGRKVKEIVTDELGHFQTAVPPGVYVAYVKPTKGSIGKDVDHAPFIVQPTRPAVLELDRMREFVYCSARGERVLSLWATSENDSKELSRLKYDRFPVKSSEGPSLKIVIEYCGKTTLPNKPIRYKSARVDYDSTSIFAATADLEFDFQRYRLVSKGGPITVVQHGRTREVPRLVFDFRGGKPKVDYTGGAISSIKGEGELRSGHISFGFKIDDESMAKFEYEDRRTGLKLESETHDCLSIISASNGSVTFGGSARVTRSNSTEKNVDFTVTVRDSGAQQRKDHFTINIPMENYRESGQLSKGDIELSRKSEVRTASEHREALSITRLKRRNDAVIRRR